MKTIDCRGMVCPLPLITTKKALNELNEDEQMIVVVDDDTAAKNVERFLKDNGIAVSLTREGSGYNLLVSKMNNSSITSDETIYCTIPPPKKKNVISFSSNCMGKGSDELGAILMKAFVNTIGETSPLPWHCVFYNSGIKLVVKGSTLIEPLAKLADRGVTILVCGTCLDYFKEKENLQVGTVSNMYTILETMSLADTIIQP